ncbi:MAG: protein kinase [Planctomycetota bacterium]
MRKVFETGHASAAEDEAHLGEQLAGPGFVTYLGAERDPESGRPSTLTRFVRGRDLWQLVKAEGPLPPRHVVALGLALHRILRRLHGIAIHRDVKPANLLIGDGDPDRPEVTLLDAEHAWLFQNTHRRSAFSGGTHGWSPPEAYGNALPTPSFDVFGLGATLWFAATGRPPLPAGEEAATHRPRLDQLLGLPAALAALLDDCMCADPDRRPSLADLEDCLVTLQAEPSTPFTIALDRALAAAQRSDLATAKESLAVAAVNVAAYPADAARYDFLCRRVERHRRLLARHPLPVYDDEPPPCDELALRLRRLTNAVARFPAHAGLQDELVRQRRFLARALDGLAETVADHKRAARFAEAHAALGGARAAIAAAAPLGGPLVELPPGAAPTALQRAPMRLVALAEDDLGKAQARHESMLAELERAEADLDVVAAVQAIDHAVAIYSGASEVVANLKDRLHRLTYFVERLAQPREALAPLAAEVANSGARIDLGAVDRCLDRCREQCDGRTAKSPLGLRALQRTLHDLGEELPATRASTDPAEHALSAALATVSQQAWRIVDDCRTKLQAVPIPIRPLQNAIARLDHLRLIDALVDCDRGTRAGLLDEVEHIRSDLDQARTTRDRIASGAREAMERGHLTTALYDMARAVDRYDAPASELEEARKRKHEVEEAVRENHRLAAHYVELEDDPTSAVEERIAALEQRREVLDLLCARVAAERAHTYAQDRLDVEVRILQERTADAERRIDTLTDPTGQLDLALATLAELDRFAATHGADLERLGRVQRLREHWENLRERARGEVARSEAAQREARRRRRRSLVARALMVGLTLALTVSVYFLWRRNQQADPLHLAAEALGHRLATPFAADTFDPVRAVLEVERFADELHRSGVDGSGVDGSGELVAAAQAMARVVRGIAGAEIGPERWIASLTAARERLARAREVLAPARGADGETLARALQRFEAASETAALLLAARVLTDSDDRSALQRYASERRLALRF